MSSEKRTREQKRPKKTGLLEHSGGYRGSRSAHHVRKSEIEGCGPLVVRTRRDRPASGTAERPHRPERIRHLLEAIALLRAAPRGISEPICRMGGVREWLWRARTRLNRSLWRRWSTVLGGKLRHSLTLAERNGRPALTDEQVEPSGTYHDERVGRSYYRPPRESEPEAEFLAGSPKPPGLVGPPTGPPRAFVWFKGGGVSGTEATITPNILWFTWPVRIRLYRNWSFGPAAELRQSQSAHNHADYLDEGGDNLALVLSQLTGDNKRQLVAALQRLFDGIADVTISVRGGMDLGAEGQIMHRTKLVLA